MRNQPSLPVNVAEKRFEALFRREMMEHQHLISSHQKEMNILRDSLNLAIERFKSISDKVQGELEELKTSSTYNFNVLHDRVKNDERLVQDQRKTVDDLHQEIIGIYAMYSAKRDTDKLKKEIDEQFKNCTVSHLNSFQVLQMELKVLVQDLKNDLMKMTSDINKKLLESTEKAERDFSIAQIDKDSVLKEVRIYKKDMFVIEKKIENIYTLIERINKRGEPCHKPA